MCVSEAAFGVCSDTRPAICVTLDSSCEATATSDARILGSVRELAPHLVRRSVFQRLHLQQRVDEEPVALGRGHAARRGMRRADEAVGLQVGHHIADRGGTEVQARIPRQAARPDRLAFADIALDQHLQQLLGTFAELGFVASFRVHWQADASRACLRVKRRLAHRTRPAPSRVPLN